MAFSISAAWKGLPMHLVEALGVDEKVGADQLHQLAEVHLRDQHLAVGAQDLAEVGRERVEVAQVGVGDRSAPGPRTRRMAAWMAP